MNVIISLQTKVHIFLFIFKLITFTYVFLHLDLFLVESDEKPEADQDVKKCEVHGACPTS